MARSLVVVLCAALAFAAGVVPRAARAQTQAWNQEVVTTLAGELEKSVTGLRNAVRGSPNLDNPAFRRKIYQIVDNLRLIEQSSSSLHAALEKGAGMEETLPTYKRLQQVRRDTEVLAQQVDITAVTRPKLDQAKDILSKIEPYYPAEPEGPAEKSEPK
jgi:glucose-6-phosphate-specific signal transduction histidine kinase